MTSATCRSPDAREVWRDVMVLQTEIAEAEQDLLLRDRTIDQLLRVILRSAQTAGVDREFGGSRRRPQRRRSAARCAAAP